MGKQFEPGAAVAGLIAGRGERDSVYRSCCILLRYRTPQFRSWYRVEANRSPYCTGFQDRERTTRLLRVDTSDLAGFRSWAATPLVGVDDMGPIRFPGEMKQESAPACSHALGRRQHPWAGMPVFGAVRTQRPRRRHGCAPTNLSPRRIFSTHTSWSTVSSSRPLWFSLAGSADGAR